MESTSGSLNQTGRTQPDFTGSPLVEVTRTFHAPVEQVWQAWSDAELVKQWWGPEEFTCPEARLDFKEGGTYLFAMKGPDGKVVWSGGIFEEIVPNQRIVWTDRFMDSTGEPVPAAYYGMPGEWPDTLLVTVDFESVGPDECRMKLVHEGIPREMHDDCVKGWSSSINKLQRLVERN
jgi:uncharacterized protein YndB with AHSA1/START domain